MIRAAAASWIRTFSGERGIALVCALMVTTLLAVVCAALVLLLTTEAMIGVQYRAGQDALYAADAAIERSTGTLRQAGDWSATLVAAAAGQPSDLLAPAAARTADGKLLDLAALTAARQSESVAKYGSGSDAPVWMLFACAPIDYLLSVDSMPAPAYIVVWVADDADGDSDPLRDANGRLLLRADAFGPRGVRRSVEAMVARDPAPASGIRLIAWRQVR